MIPPALHRVEEPLRKLVLSMLKVSPAKRPSAAQLVQALSQAPTSPPSERVELARGSRWERVSPGWVFLAAGLALGLWEWEMAVLLYEGVEQERAGRLLSKHLHLNPVLGRPLDRHHMV